MLSLTGVCVVESHRFSSDSIKHQCVFILKTRSTMLLSQECVLLSLTGVCVVESDCSDEGRDGRQRQVKVGTVVS